jgi:excisionase family DNA binding protein
MTERPWYTVGAVARLVSLSTSTVRRDVQLGELRAVKRRGGRGYYWIAADEARRYVVQLGCRWPFDAGRTP